MKIQPVATPELIIAAIRSLVIDMTNNAKSGHPGMALDAAPAVYALFHDHLLADPRHPDWDNRDRFVLSSGHNSALLYAILHLSGYKLSMDDIKSFRQLGSITPGHPEVGVTEGVDASGGPLGQGIAQAVGMAMAEKTIRAQYPGTESFFSHYTYCLCGDGCLEEGISQEAISLAGKDRLNKLILIYDANGATLDGPTSDSLTENVKLRFLASEWDVIEVEDGNDYKAVSKAIEKAKKSTTYPTLILMHTRIGFGSRKEGSHKSHGEPLGEEDGAFAKSNYKYPYPAFTVPKDVYVEMTATIGMRGERAYIAAKEAKKAFGQAHPDVLKRYEDGFSRNYEAYPVNWPEFELGKSEATRAVSGKCLQALHDALPFTFGGSADVASSTKTGLKDEPIFSDAHPEGRDVHWGIREFAMTAACNGIALHGGLLPYCSTFFVFSDYMKPAIRLAALQNLQAIYLLSHDSIAVGEDGPTHQPIEQFAMLRSIPNVDLFRPCDGKETVAAYQHALNRKNGPTAIVISRQGLPHLQQTCVEKALRGGYLVREDRDCDYLLLATGSEVAVTLSIANKLAEKGVRIAVASIPCLDLFLRQDRSYINHVLCAPRGRTISIEMASTFGWGMLAEYNIGIDTFGASGKQGAVIESFGFDEASLLAKVEKIVLKR